MQPVGHTLTVRVDNERHTYKVVKLEALEGCQLLDVYGPLSLFNFGYYDAIYRTTTHEIDGVFFASTYKFVDFSDAIYSGSFRPSGEWRPLSETPPGRVKR